MTLWSFTAREVKNRPGRAILTLLSIVIGVAAVVSVSLATSTTRKAYRDMLRAVHGKADLVVSGTGGASFSGDLLAEIDKTPGVVASAASIHESVEIRYTKKGPDNKPLKDENGDPIRDKLQSKVLGIDVARDRAVREFEVISGVPELKPGEWFTENKTVTVNDLETNVGSLVIDESVASSLRLDLNDVVGLGTRKAGRVKLSDFRVTAIVKAKEGAAVSAGAFIFLDLPIAQKLCRSAGQVDFIHVVGDDKAGVEVVQAALQATVANSGTQGIAVEKAGINTKQAEESLIVVEEGLRLATAMTLVLAAFIIVNTFLMNVGERRRQLSIMRAIGATRGQIVRLLLKEGVLMGLVGSGIGIVLGIVGAFQLTKVMANLFQAKLHFQISLIPCLVGAGFGLGLSIIGVYFPARKAGKLSPLEGMARVAVEDQQKPIGFLSALREGTGALAQSLTGRAPKNTEVIWPVLGMLLVTVCGGILYGCIRGAIPMYFAVTTSVGLMIGVVLLLPTVLQPITRITTKIAAPLLGITGGLAGGQLIRRRTRTALTIGVLFLAMSLGIAVGSGVIDTVSDVRNWYRNTLVADYFVRATIPDPNGDTVPMDESLCEKILKMSDEKTLITGLETSRYISKQVLDLEGYPKARDKRMNFTVITRDFILGDKPNLNLVDGVDKYQVKKDLHAGQVVVGTVLAQRAGLEVGDDLPLVTKENKVQKLKIAALVNDYMVSGMIVYMTNETALKYMESKGIAGFAIDVNKARTPEAAAALKALTQEYGVIFQSNEQLVKNINGMVDGAVSGQWMILILGFVVSAFGIVNTLTMNVLEQTRELGLLRIVAMTRRQVRRLILSQAALIGVLGLLPGMFGGWAVAWLLNRAMLPVIGHPIPMQFHPELLIGSFLVGLIIVVLSAMFPAERAARIELATALQYE